MISYLKYSTFTYHLDTVMKNFYFHILVFILIPISNFAQGPIVSEIGQLIQSGDITKANKRVAYYLQENSNEVDALMMQGNIWYNTECCDNIPTLEANLNESIYSNEIGLIGGQQPVIVPKVLGTKIANIWKKAVSHDLERKDIHFGICHIYSTSLMTEELISYLPTLKKYAKEDDRLHYSMCDYARNIKDRGDFDSAMKVYNYIAKLFPNKKGLLSDIAAEYFLHGDIELAKKNIDEALKEKNLDEMSLGNAFFFNSVMGNYSDALTCIKRQSQVTNNSDYLLYEGLLQFLKNEDWRKTMENFIRNTTNSDWKKVATYMTNDNFKSTIENYKELTQFKIHDGFMVIIHDAFRTKLPNNSLAHINFGELLTYNKQYNKASLVFKKIENSNLIKTTEEIESLAFYHGWVLWELNNKKESIEKWTKLINSKNFQYQSASAYFLGKFYYDLNNNIKAKSYFKIVSERASESKFATLSWNYLNNIKK